MKNNRSKQVIQNSQANYTSATNYKMFFVGLFIALQSVGLATAAPKIQLASNTSASGVANNASASRLVNNVTSSQVPRDSSSSRMSVSPEVKNQGDLDKEVTDNKLRAVSGAKKKYSSSFTLMYMGASLTKPGDDRRPNVGNSRMASPVSISGDFGARYRFNKNESMTVGAGLYRARPFHKREDEQLEINTPQLGYNNTFALGDTQISNGVRAYFTTQEQFKEIGELGTLGYSLTALHQIAQTRLSASLSMRPYVTFYDMDKDSPFMTYTSRGPAYVPVGRMQSDYGVGLSPGLQYNKSGRISAFTSLNILNYTHYRDAKPFNFEEGTFTQTAGMGIAVMRDFYLAPFVSFEPENIDSNKTSVNMSATINL